MVSQGKRDFFERHKGLIEIFKESPEPDPEEMLFWPKLLKKVKHVSDYLIALPSSQEFNEVPLKTLDESLLKENNGQVKRNQSIDMTKVVVHIGHPSLQDKTSLTWSQLLQGGHLPERPLYYFLESALNAGHIYHQGGNNRVKFIEYEGEYYISNHEPLYMPILAKYLISANEERRLEGVSVLELASPD